MDEETTNQEESKNLKRFKGLVKWFNDAKGFGFIQHEDGQDVFVHYSVIEQDGFRTLKDGEEVEYEMKPSDKGLQASKVSRVDNSELKIEESKTESGDLLSSPKQQQDKKDLKLSKED